MLEGTIAREPRGGEGFGYDPVFVPDGEERTVAELGDAWKARATRTGRAPPGRCSTALEACRRDQLISAPKTITFAIT